MLLTGYFMDLRFWFHPCWVQPYWLYSRRTTMTRLKDALLGLVLLAAAFFAVWVMSQVLVSPAKAAEVAPEEPKATGSFVNGLQLHNSCAAKQPQCIVYIYGVLDTLINSMQCEERLPASRETMVDTLTALATSNGKMEGEELEKLNAAETVALAFTRTPTYHICKGEGKAL